MTTQIPKLRFPEFEGEWEKKKIGDLCNFIVPGRNKPTSFNGDIPWITTPDIEHNGTIYYSKKKLFISKEEAKKIGSKIVPKNSIVISCVGELGLAAIVGTEIVINQQLHAFLPKSRIEYRFLLYSLWNQKQYMEKVATKTAVPYMNKDNCNSIPISFPTLPEQTKIANFLTAIDTKIQQLTQKKALLEEYKKGVMQQLFSGTSARQPIRFKDENGADYPDWEEKKLGEVGKFVGGGTPSTQNKEFWQGDIPWISSSDLSDDSIFKINITRFITQEAIQSSPVKLIPPNSILIVSRVGVGKVAINEKALCTSQDFASLIASTSEYYSLFLAYLIKFQTGKLLGFNQGTSIKGFVKSDLENLEVSIPCYNEQLKIANYFFALDTKIQTVAKQIGQTQAYKKGLLQQLFV